MIRKTIFYALIALFCISCDKEDEAVFEPATFVFSGNYVNEEVEFFKGDSCMYDLDSARAYVENIMSVDSFNYFITDSIVFYSPDKARYHARINDSAQVFECATAFADDIIVLNMELEPGMRAIIRGFGDLNSFYFIAGISGVNDPNNESISMVQGSSAMYEKSFELQDISSQGFQLNLFYEAPYVKL